jgi:cytochrome P450
VVQPLDPYDREQQADPNPLYRELRAREPLHRNPRDVPQVQEWAERSVWIGADQIYASEAQLAALQALLGYLADALAERRKDARPSLRAEPGLIADAFEEIVRWGSPAQGFKRALTRRVELHGRWLEPGETVLLVTGSANRDEREFPDPDAFRIERRPRRHLGFGQGIHYCIGAPLARLEGRIGLGVLLEQFGDWEVEPGAVRAHTARFMLRGWEKLPLVFAAHG